MPKETSIHYSAKTISAKGKPAGILAPLEHKAQEITPERASFIDKVTKLREVVKNGELPRFRRAITSDKKSDISFSVDQNIKQHYNVDASLEPETEV